MTKLSKGDYVRIQTDEPESAFNGYWGVVQGYDSGCVMVAVGGLDTKDNTLPFDREHLIAISRKEAEAIEAREANAKA